MQWSTSCTPNKYNQQRKMIQRVLLPQMEGKRLWAGANPLESRLWFCEHRRQELKRYKRSVQLIQYDIWWSVCANMALFDSWLNWADCFAPLLGERGVLYMWLGTFPAELLLESKHNHKSAVHSRTTDNGRTSRTGYIRAGHWLKRDGFVCNLSVQDVLPKD